LTGCDQKTQEFQPLQEQFKPIRALPAGLAFRSDQQFPKAPEAEHGVLPGGFKEAQETMDKARPPVDLAQVLAVKRPETIEARSKVDQPVPKAQVLKGLDSTFPPAQAAVLPCFRALQEPETLQGIYEGRCVKPGKQALQAMQGLFTDTPMGAPAVFLQRKGSYTCKEPVIHPKLLSSRSLALVPRQGREQGACICDEGAQHGLQQRVERKTPEPCLGKTVEDEPCFQRKEVFMEFQVLNLPGEEPPQLLYRGLC
jgi:hypothetical protein